MTQYFEKDPNNVADYQINWANLIGADTISGTPVWTITPSGLTKDSQTNTTTTSTIWLSGGVAGVTYTVNCRITTAGLRTFDEDLIIGVKESSGVRQGMWPYITQVRALTGAGTSEYTVGDLTFWSDDDIQRTLDQNANYFVNSPLMWQPITATGGTLTYLTAQAAYSYLEAAPGTVNTSRLIIRDGAGSAVGTSSYTIDYQAGRITFGSDQGGTAYYLSGYTYDVYDAAADIWLERIAHFNEWYDFSADNQTFNRSQAWEHAMKMEKLMRAKAGQNVIGSSSGDLRVSQFVRTDISGWGGMHYDRD
jgi:hypothetical protein